MYELYCIGHITLDKIVTLQKTAFLPGGTSYYFSYAINKFKDIDYLLVTAVGPTEMKTIDNLCNSGIKVKVLPSRKSVYFENIYGENPDNRIQRVLAKADPFTTEHLKDINAHIYHLGTLLSDDFTTDTIKYLSTKGIVSVDSQGYLRKVINTHVYSTDWKDKIEALKYIHILKANEVEAKALTGYSDVKKAAIQLYEWGVKEVLITLGSQGSVVYDGHSYLIIPAYIPQQIIDTTGCGDTYMTGYLYQRAHNTPPEESARFAAAMSTLKIGYMGPFDGNKEDVYACMETAQQVFPSI